jgi:hypothetical protein
MLRHVRVALGVVIFFVAPLSAHAADGITSTITVLPPDTVGISLVQGPDGNLWFSDANNVSASNAYIVRIGPGVALSFFPTPRLRLPSGRLERTIVWDIANAPHSANRPWFRSGPKFQPVSIPSQLVFYWFTVDNLDSPTTSESGLGTVDVARPSVINEYAAQLPGDPLYSPKLTLDPFGLGLASSASPPYVWLYAHADTSSNSAQEFVVGYRYPFVPSMPVAAYPIGTTAPPEYSGAIMTTGVDGNVYFTSPIGAIGRIDSTGTAEFRPNGFLAEYIFADDGNLWTTGFSADGPTLARFTYFGQMTGSFNDEVLTYDPLRNAAADGTFWSLARDEVNGIFYFTRRGNTGQLTLYGVRSQLAVGNTFPTSVAVATDGTVWATFWNALPEPHVSTLISMKSNRVGQTFPQQLTLGAGQSALVAVSETNYGGTAFTSSVPYSNCPLTVAPGAAAGTFVVGATSAPYPYCGVLFTDPDGISVWLPVVGPGESPGNNPRRAPDFQREPFGSSAPSFFGKRLYP